MTAFSVMVAAAAAALSLGVGPVSTADREPVERQGLTRADGLPPLMLGPGDAGVSDIGGQAIVRMSKWGFVYIAGKQNTRLKVTYLTNPQRIRYRDTGTSSTKSLHDRCRHENVQVGISVVCTIPPEFQSKMFVQVWPRLGNDFVDGSSLPAKFRLWVLGDAGNDVMLGGAGGDFFNGAFNGDRATGGAGNDWLRGGPAWDNLDGGAGEDKVVQ